MRDWTLYLTVLLAAVGESSAFVGLLVPGVGIVLAAAVVAARGGADPVWVGAWASLGAVIGFGLSYHLGRAGGPRVSRWSRRAEAALARAHGFFRRYGTWSVFLGHFFGPVRALVAFAAGAAGLEPRRFWAASVSGGVAWGYGMAVSGLAVAGGWTLLEARLGRASLVLGLLAVLAYVAFRLAAGLLFLGLRLLPPTAGAAVRGIEWLHRRPVVGRLLRDHPTVGRWMERRLSPGHATGLLLTTGVAACLTLATGLGVTARSVALHAPVVRLDQKVFHLLQSVRTPEADRWFLGITALGDLPVLLVLVAAAAALALRAGRRYEAALLSGGFAAGEALCWAAKLWAGRPRPAPPLPLDLPATPAFPSHHAFSSLVVYGFLCYLAVRGSSGRRRSRAYAAAGIVVAAVGLSRLYLGVHWLTDVLGGLALGGAWATALITAAEVHRRFGPPRPSVAAPRRRRIAAAALGIVVAAWAGGAWFRIQGASPSPAAEAGPSPLSVRDLAARRARLASDPVETLTGRPLGTVQAVVVGAAERIRAAAAGEGWTPARPLDAGVLIAEAGRLFSRAADPAAPVSPRFWRNRPQDLAFRQAGHRVACLWETGWRAAGGHPVWVVWEAEVPAPRRLWGLRLPGAGGAGLAAGRGRFPLDLVRSGAFRPAPAPPSEPGPALLVPAPFP
ncbi:MAG: hypothetical protein Kow0092_00200 [Deferrisomatales bacterium]